jgi:hypothetical protein
VIKPLVMIEEIGGPEQSADNLPVAPIHAGGITTIGGIGVGVGIPIGDVGGDVGVGVGVGALPTPPRIA